MALLNSTAHLIEQNCNITKGWVTGDLTLTPNDIPGRHKRFGLTTAFTLGSAFGGFVANWIQSSKISQIENKLSVQNDQILEILKAYADTEGAIASLQFHMATVFRQHTVIAYANYLQAHAQTAARTIDRVHATVTSLFSGKLSLSTLPPHQLHKIFKDTHQLARDNDVHLPITSPLQLLELPATFTKNANGITIQLFVPLINRQLTLYKYLNTPVYLQGASSAKLASIQTSHQLIATDDDGGAINVPMTHADLDACLHIGNHHICTDLVKHLRYESSCIGNLFSRSAEKVLKNCAFHWDPQPWRFDKRSNSTYLLSTTVPIVLQVQCLAQNKRFDPADRKHDTIYPGQTSVHVPPGCTMTTEDIAITGTQLSIASVGLAMPIDWDLQETLLDGLNLEALEEVSDKIRDHGLAHSTEIAHQIHLSKTLPRHTLHQTQHVLAAVLVIIASLIVVPCVIAARSQLRRARRERNHPLHAVLARIMQRAPIEPLQEAHALQAAHGPPEATAPPANQGHIYPNPLQLPNVPQHDVL